MINEATNPETMTDKPWTWVPATVVILIVVLAIIFIGNALRRVADQRQATRQTTFKSDKNVYLLKMDMIN